MHPPAACTALRSSPRKRGPRASRLALSLWMPAFAGMSGRETDPGSRLARSGLLRGGDALRQLVLEPRIGTQRVVGKNLLLVVRREAGGVIDIALGVVEI